MNEKSKLLVVDDEKINLNILIDLLSDEYEVYVALNGKKALDIVQKKKIDLILLDIMMPDMSGYELCNMLKSNDKTKDIPVLFITAKMDDESIEKGFKIGGVDYITKPFRPIELQARIKTHLNLSQTLKSLEFLATRDPMTGIFNRGHFFKLGMELFDNTENLFAIIIDIDKFKSINDTYGHPFGDVVIKTIVKKISKMIYKDAVFGRIGGEEFAILCNANSIENIKQKIEKIRCKIEKTEIKYQDKIVKVTISNGIAQKHENDNLDTLLKRADEALYMAKGSGRNRSYFRD